MQQQRVLSGMRPTGALHIGHYHGAICNWVQLQHSHECYFFVADWHALTTHYQDTGIIASSVREMVIDWLACGLDPAVCTLFRQSHLPEHAELFTLLAMGTPLGWLERIPTYKDQIEKLRDKDLATYGFLGYPLLQAADILMYRAQFVPVGEDQASHVEMTREVARRFNHLYGRGGDHPQRVAQALAKMNGAAAQRYEKVRKAYSEKGSSSASDATLAYVQQHPDLSAADKELLSGHLRGGARTILPEPQTLLTQASRLPGLDGEKMSKSYGNTIAIREKPQDIRQKIKRMPTDPARARRTDPGKPERCPVWQFHQVYSTAQTRTWVRQGCVSAGIGCIECKQPLAEAIIAWQQPMLERAEPYLQKSSLVDDILEQGGCRARTTAQATMREVRSAMGL